MLNVIMFLQLIKVMSIYKVNIPAILEIFLKEIRKMVDFETINADNLLGLVSDDLSVKVLISG